MAIAILNTMRFFAQTVRVRTKRAVLFRYLQLL